MNGESIKLVRSVKFSDLFICNNPKDNLDIECKKLQAYALRIKLFHMCVVDFKLKTLNTYFSHTYHALLWLYDNNLSMRGFSDAYHTVLKISHDLSKFDRNGESCLD